MCTDLWLGVRHLPTDHTDRAYDGRTRIRSGERVADNTNGGGTGVAELQRDHVLKTEYAGLTRTADEIIPVRPHFGAQTTHCNVGFPDANASGRAERQDAEGQRHPYSHGIARRHLNRLPTDGEDGREPLTAKPFDRRIFRLAADNEERHGSKNGDLSNAIMAP